VSNERLIANMELGRMWKDTVMSYFKILFQHLCRGAEEYQEHLGWPAPRFKCRGFRIWDKNIIQLCREKSIITCQLCWWSIVI
jgi:hypothetical protein